MSFSIKPNVKRYFDRVNRHHEILDQKLYTDVKESVHIITAILP